MKIVIVGGGTAGYLSALLFRHYYNDVEIVLIESSKHGILGAGEGTTPIFNYTLKMLDINIQEFIEKTMATPKVAIKFINFGTKKPYYYHTFYDLDVENRKSSVGKIAFAAKNDTNLDKINMGAYLCETKSFDIQNINETSWHIDAVLLADFLKQESLKRNIKIIDESITTVEKKSSSEISRLNFESGSFIEADFFVDCTGFRRLLIGETLKSEWISMGHMLPAKKACAFFMEMNESPIPPYTESIAMNYGWIWRIPLRHRWGCGYVFDTDYISEEEAKQEIVAKFGENITFAKTFNFNSGYYKDPLIGNCLAIGVSSGFFEPLEATSINMSLIMLHKFLISSFSAIKQNDIEMYKKMSKEFNNFVSDGNSKFASFIYLHYITNKKNTKFWSDFTINNKMPDLISKFLKSMESKFFTNSVGIPFSSNKKLRMLTVLSKRHIIWASWLTVYIGNEIYGNLSKHIDNNSKNKYLSDKALIFNQLSSTNLNQIFKNGVIKNVNKRID